MAFVFRCSFKYLVSRFGITAPADRLDSMCKYCMVATGQSELYLRLVSSAYAECIWDHAPGVVLVTEAGGQVSDYSGKPLEFGHGRTLTANRGVVATNATAHDMLLAALREAPSRL
jgi:3'-phosphoadenosine 5'-phosphosulfate (PAPS) 3'-phosphatase